MVSGDGLIALSMKGKALRPSDLLTTPQACRFLDVTRQTLYLWMGKGKLKPWMRVGGASWLFERSEVQKLKGTKHERRNGRERK